MSTGRKHGGTVWRVGKVRGRHTCPSSTTTVAARHCSRIESTGRPPHATWRGCDPWTAPRPASPQLASGAKQYVCIIIEQYPVRWTAQSALHFTRWQTCTFRHQSDLSGKHSSHAAITHISTAAYSQVAKQYIRARVKLTNTVCNTIKTLSSNNAGLSIVGARIPLLPLQSLVIFALSPVHSAVY